MFCTRCNFNDDDIETPRPVPPGSVTSGPAPHPDFVIPMVDVFPAHPQSVQFLALNAYITNEGDTPSGEYDLAIHINDISHGFTCVISTFREPGLRPRHNVPFYTSQNQQVNDVGSYQVRGEIAPFLFDDGNTWNNSVSKPFTAK